MKTEYTTFRYIRGTRYDIALTKQVEGMPGFAPEYRDVDVCKICVKYLDGEPPFVQFFNEPPNLEINEVKEILQLLKTGFRKKDFPPPKPTEL